MTYAIGKDALKQSVQVTDSDEQAEHKLFFFASKYKQNLWYVWIAYADRIRPLIYSLI